ncbi:MAG: hypothetical protein JW991_02615 [Candidatus Pacebacteria bacterium]|nr:hypothetical protein [Candidatus Paceibacterota bacterium]
MSQVSRHPLEKKVEKQVFKLFSDVIDDLRGKEEVKFFFKDLLSPTEKIMLGKRVAIALMLLKGYDYQSINETLKVSSATIGKVALWLKHAGKGYREVLGRAIKKQKSEQFWTEIDWQLSRILPPKGKNWKETFRTKAAARKAAQAPFG